MFERSELSRCGLGLWWMAVIAVCVGVRAQTTTAIAGGLLLPSGVAYDSVGNLFFADPLKDQVFEVSLAGVTSVVAGTGVQGFAGDGGLATAALLNGPAGVAVTSDGTLYIADTGNERIRSVVQGRIQTVAGNGAPGFFDGGGDARLAMLHRPVALAVEVTSDVPGILIADSGNHRVRRLSAGKLTTVAGSGVQGFAGDGGAALSAQLDTPMGVAQASDGRIFVADSHNHRLRAIASDGTIATFAGGGQRGFSGDGGPAVNAALYLPSGVSVTTGGDVVFTDSDNHRVRSVNAAGVITTIAGNGAQGTAGEGTVAVQTSLDTPRGVAVSSFGSPVFSDSRNRKVEEVAGAQAIYAVAPNAARVTNVTLSGPDMLTYGKGSMTVTIQGSAPAPVGNVVLRDGGGLVENGTLANAATVLPVDSLSAGIHSLSASFAGDGLHAASVSAPMSLIVTPASVTATPTPATVVYGGALPMLSGTLTGLLPRDAGKVTVAFTSTASDLAPVGTYPITASISGSASGNYELAAGGSLGGLQIVQASANVAIGTPSIAYAGLPLTLTASLVSLTRGTPTGTVNFLDNGTVVATANASGGLATGVYLGLAAGTHTLSATYSGDHNFLPSNSTTASVSVAVMPDFTVALSGSGTETVQGGGIATYTLQVSPQALPFSGVVGFSASGLPSGAVASFSPVNVVPGSSTVPVTMSVQTRSLAVSSPRRFVAAPFQLAIFLALPLAWMRRRHLHTLAGLGLLVTLALSGCGARTLASGQPAATFSLRVTATSTNLAGAAVEHAVLVNLIVD